MITHSNIKGDLRQALKLTLLFEGEVLCEMPTLVVASEEEERGGMVDLQSPQVQHALQRDAQKRECPSEPRDESLLTNPRANTLHSMKASMLFSPMKKAASKAAPCIPTRITELYETFRSHYCSSLEYSEVADI